MEFFKNIPIGQYVPGESFIHRLDPRTKIIFVFIFVIMIFVADTGVSLAIYGVIALLFILASKLSFTYLWSGLKGMLFLIVLVGVLQIFFIKEGNLLWSWSWIEVYQGGVTRAVFVTLRLVFLVLMTSLLTLTTSPMDLTDGLERLFHPLNRFRVPVHEIALMMTIALRYIPTLMEETDKIIKAQTARGADFESKNLVNRMKSLFPLLVPLFISSFRRAEDLALAMEARCYRGGEGRSRRKTLQMTKRDTLVLGASILLLGAAFL